MRLADEAGDDPVGSTGRSLDINTEKGGEIVCRAMRDVRVDRWDE